MLNDACIMKMARLMMQCIINSIVFCGSTNLYIKHNVCMSAVSIRFGGYLISIGLTQGGDVVGVSMKNRVFHLCKLGYTRTRTHTHTYTHTHTHTHRCSLLS